MFLRASADFSSGQQRKSNNLNVTEANMSQPSEDNFYRVLRQIFPTIVVLIIPVIAQAQSFATKKTEPTKLAAASETVSTPANSAEAAVGNVDDRLRALEEELRQQSKS